MKRAYTRSRYMEKLAKVRDAIPNVAVTTDIIVGFPGETDDDFNATMSLVQEAEYDGAYTFQYSSRPMTEAADMDDHLPKAIVQERFDRLVSLQERISYERNMATIGRTEQLLVEGTSKKDATRSTGRTRSNKLVHFEGEVEPGSLARAEIVDAHPHHLEGRLLQVEGTSPRGMTLPLVQTAAGCDSCQ